MKLATNLIYFGKMNFFRADLPVLGLGVAAAGLRHLKARLLEQGLERRGAGLRPRLVLDNRGLVHRTESWHGFYRNLRRISYWFTLRLLP